ncbi:MAG: SurA N-terminal domain-containing protein [Rhizobiaceae bacterium]
MLQILRSSVGGWVAKTFIGLLVLSFAVWGVSGAFVNGAADYVIQVGETKVGLLDYRLTYDQRLNAMSRQLGTRLSREQARAFQIEQTVLSQLTSGAILDESARKMGLGLSEDELAKLIGNDPAFRDAAGTFSRSQLTFALQRIGMREEDYLRNRSAVSIRSQIVEGTANGVEVPETFIKALAMYQKQKRQFDYVIVDKSAIGDTPVATDSDISAFYADNKNDYVAPEYRKLNVLKLEASDIADEDSVDDQAVKDEYEATKASFVDAEKRKIQQLVLTDPAKAKKIVERLKGGELFETILSEEGKSESDVELGVFVKSDLPDVAIADAAFALELNKSSDVVTGIFGPVILRVTEIIKEKTTPFAEVKDKIRKDMALKKASDELFDIHDRIEDERAAGDSLADAAKTLGLKMHYVEMIDRSGRLPDGSVYTDLPASAKMLDEAFKIDVGVEADPISLSVNGFAWFEVAKVINERQKPLDEVRDAVSTAWVVKTTSDKIKVLADTLNERVSAGEKIADVATDLLPTSVKVDESAELLRTDESDDLSRDAVQAGFGVATGKSVATASGADKYVVLVVKNIIESGSSSVDIGMINQINSTVSDDILNQMVNKLQQNEAVNINQQAIETALSIN